MALVKATVRLVAGSRVHNVQLLRRAVCFDCVSKQLEVTFTEETLGKPTCFGVEQIKCLPGGGLGLCLQGKILVVAHCVVDTHEDVAGASNDNCGTESNVNVDLVQVLVHLLDNGFVTA